MVRPREMGTGRSPGSLTSRPAFSSRPSQRPAKTSSKAPSAALSFSSTRHSPSTAASPASLLSCHSSLLQLRTDLSELAHTDLLLKTRIRTFQARIAFCKQQSVKLSQLPTVSTSSSSSSTSSVSAPARPPPVPAVVSQLLAYQRSLQQSIAELDALFHTQSAIAGQVEDEGRAVLELHSEAANLEGRLKGEERARKEEACRAREHLDQLRDDVARIEAESANIRMEVLQLEEEAVEEEERGRELSLRLEARGLTAAQPALNEGRAVGRAKRSPSLRSS